MATIVKNKNYIEIYMANEKPYLFNINTGDLIGIKGNPLKRVPAGFNEVMRTDHHQHNVLAMMYREHEYNGIAYVGFGNMTELLSIADRLEGIGFMFGNNPPSRNDLLFVDKNWKAFHKWFNDHPDRNIHHFVEENALALWCAKTGLKVDEHFTEPMARWLMNNESAFSAENLRWCAYYLAKGLWEYEGDTWACKSKLQSYFQYCKDTNTQPQKGDFMRVYVQIKRTYELNKEKFETEKITRHQLAREQALTFEHGEMVVVIPTTAQEFKDEGEMQDNCVARLYLPKVIRGETNVVFIRKKNNPNKSYITCEVRNGEIYQFYLRFNHSVSEQADIDFRNAYQKHLRENW